MRIASLALALAGVALAVGLLTQPAERASANHNISGQWFLELNSGAAVCKAIVEETYETPPTYSLSMLVGCAPAIPFGKMTGTIDANTGSFFVSRVDNTPVTGYNFSMSGTVSLDNHSMSGTWTAHSHVTPGLEGTFTGTGGDGGPKPGTSTPTATATATATLTPTPTPTPDAVGGLAFDAPSSDGSAFDAWWWVAIAGAAFVTLGGAALYAKGRN